MRTFFLITLILPVYLYSEFSVQILQFKQVSTLQALFFFFSLFTLIAIFFLFERSRQKREFLAKIRAEKHLFNLNVERTGLNNKELLLLKKIGSHLGKKSNNVLFDSIEIYEECLDKEISNYKGLDTLSFEEAEETLTSLRRKLGYNFLDNDHPLASTRNISIGMALSVFSGSSKAIILQEARVVANKEFFIKIQYKNDSTIPTSLREGDTIRLVFARQADGMYEVEINVIALTQQNSFTASHTTVFKRIQLRRDIRLDINSPIKFKLVKCKDKNREEFFAGKVLEGKIADVSGGGISFVNDMELQPEDELSLHFSLSDGPPLSGIHAKILRVSAASRKDELLSQFHLQFIDINASHRDRIIKFIFEKMRLRKQTQI